MVKASVVAIFNEIIVHNWLKYCLVAEKKAPSGRQKEKPAVADGACRLCT